LGGNIPCTKYFQECTPFSQLDFPNSSSCSGHAATSIGLLTYLLLELFVHHPNLLCGLSCQKRGHRSAYSSEWGYGWQKQTDDDEQRGSMRDATGVAGDSTVIEINDTGNSKNVEETNVSPDPLLDRNRESSPPSSTLTAYTTWMRALTIPFQGKWLHHWYALGYLVLLFPVPFSRVYLHDHSPDQVMAGSFVGIVASTVWYLGFVRNCGMWVIEWKRSKWGKWWGLK